MTKTAIADNGEILTGRAATERRYYLKNQAKKLAYGKEWREKNPEKVEANSIIQGEKVKEIRRAIKVKKMEDKLVIEMSSPHRIADPAKAEKAAYAREYRAKNKERMNAYMRDYRKQNPDKIHAFEKESKSRNAYKQLMRRRFYSAVKAGKITRPDSCEVCNVPCNPKGHHSDYANWMGVNWLCDKCHSEADIIRRASESLLLDLKPLVRAS